MRRRYFWQGVSDFASISYLKKRGFQVADPSNFTLPQKTEDYVFVNNPNSPPDVNDLTRLRCLGHILARSGVINVN
jgi:hypothetical protein